MKITGRDLVYFGALGVGAYVLYRVFHFGDTVSGALDKFWTGLTFDPETLGPPVQLTPGALESQADWIARGYLDAAGNITPAGQEYIRRQKERVIQGEVIDSDPCLAKTARGTRNVC